MPKTKISEYSSTANSNTDIASINIDEGCAPSGINNAIRALMAQIHDLYAGTTGDTWPIAGGGTGSGTASGARTNLGLAIGTDVQAYSSTLASYANGNSLGFKNRIINGAMMIDQRNAGASVTPTSDGQYASCDRWNYFLSQSSKFSTQQSTTAPTGFSNSILLTSLSSYSVTGNDYFTVNQKIEGFNFADMMWGTANAQTITLSFWVRSSLTGTFGGAMTNSAFNRSYPFSYTISAANTWEQKTVTIAGDTSGTWVGATNGAGVIAQFSIGAAGTSLGTAGAWTGSYKVSATGATSVVGTSGATLYITGVQLEKGSTATSFDYRPYGTELALCQRYYYKMKGYLIRIGGGYNSSTTGSDLVVNFPTPMRAAPTSLETSGTATDYRLVFSGSSAFCNAVPTFAVANTDCALISATVASGMTTGYTSQMRFESNNSYLGFPAEL